MHVCVNGTASMCHMICEWFKYYSPQTKICWFFARAQREFCALCRQVSSCLQTTRFLPAFFAFFQYGLINVCWVNTETIVRFIQGKLIYCAPNANCTQTTECDQGVQCVPSFKVRSHDSSLTFQPLARYLTFKTEVKFVNCRYSRRLFTILQFAHKKLSIDT